MKKPYSTKERDSENTDQEKISEHVASAINKGEEKIRDIVSHTEKTIKEGEEQLKQIVSTVNKQLHENPWPVVAGVAATSLILGFIFGTTKRGA